MTRHWPLFALRIGSERLELRLPTDGELEALADVAAAGVHDPDFMPFLNPWTRASSPELQRGFVQYHWRRRAEWTATKWALELGVFLDGEPIGSQELAATDIRVVEGHRREEQRFALDVDTWRAASRPAVTVEGLEGCRDMFGL